MTQIGGIMRRTGVVLAVAMLLAAAGCWPHPGGGPDRSYHNPLESAITTETAEDLEEAWSAEIGPIASREPIVRGNGVYVHTTETLYRLDLRTGQEVWSTTPPGEGQQFVGPVIVDGDLLIVGVEPVDPVGEEGDGLFTSWRFDAATGVAEDSDNLGNIESLRGEQSARDQRRLHNLPLSDRWLPAVTVVDDETGESWGALLGDQQSSGAIDQQFIMGDGTVYHSGVGLNATSPPNDMHDYEEGVRAYEFGARTDCEPFLFPVEGAGVACPTWARRSFGPPVLSSDGETLYTVDHAPIRGLLHALDARSGETLWRSENINQASSSGPPRIAAANGLLYVSSVPGGSSWKGVVSVLDADGCAQPPCPVLWEIETGDGFTEEPCEFPPCNTLPLGYGKIVGQPVVAGTGDDAVLAVRLEHTPTPDEPVTGRLAIFAAAHETTEMCEDWPDLDFPDLHCPIWLSDDVDLATDPVVSGGRVLAGTEDGLIAYGLASD